MTGVIRITTIIITLGAHKNRQEHHQPLVSHRALRIDLANSRSAPRRLRDGADPTPAATAELPSHSVSAAMRAAGPPVPGSGGSTARSGGRRLFTATATSRAMTTLVHTGTGRVLGVARAPARAPARTATGGCCCAPRRARLSHRTAPPGVVAPSVPVGDRPEAAEDRSCTRRRPPAHRAPPLGQTVPRT